LSKLSGLLGALAAIITLSSISMAQSIITDDAYTTNTPRYLDSNFGSNPNLALAPTSNVYLKFQFAGILPPDIVGSDISKANLKLYVGTINTPGTFDVYAAGRSWNEEPSPPRMRRLLAH
jgi:hypothetical protein